MHEVSSAKQRLRIATSLLCAALAFANCLAETVPPVVAPGTVGTQEVPGRAPSDAVVLFDGTDLSQWVGDGNKPAPWKVENGYLEVVPGTTNLLTKQAFGDCQLHVEWSTPTRVDKRDQGRGNSGVFPMSRYEVQVLDCYENETYADGGAGAIYGQEPPLVNCCRKPGEWQTYDLLFRRPQFGEDGRVVKPAFLTVFHNGVVIHHDVVLFGPMSYQTRQPYRAHPDLQPLMLQNHGDPVRYRNLWVRPLTEGVDGRDAATALARMEKAMADWPWKVNDPSRPRPPVIAAGTAGSPPSDAKVLIDGKGLTAWESSGKASVTERRLRVSGKVRTKESFGDCQVHVEWATPVDVKPGPVGVGLGDALEVQLEATPGALRGTQPVVLATRQPGEWQTLDVVLSRPRTGPQGGVTQRGALTALVNGVLVQEVQIDSPAAATPQPLALQDANGSVQFRNVWVRSLHP